MSGMMCVRPSELIFLLGLLDLNNITSTALTSSSREMSDALIHLQTSDLLGRLSGSGAALNQIGQVVSARTGGGSSAVTGSLDRELTFVLQIDKQTTYFSLESRMDDSQLSRDEHMLGLLGPLAPGATHSQTLEPANFAQGESELANMQWLVSAARSALKATYEQLELPKSASSVRQLNELRENLLSKSEVIASSLADIYRLELCKDLCSNFKAQLLLLLDQYRNRRKMQDASNGSQITSALQQMLLSTGSISIAELSASGSSSQGDDDYNVALSRMVASQLCIEGQIDAARRPMVNPQKFDGDISGRGERSRLAERRARGRPQSLKSSSAKKDSDMRSPVPNAVGSVHVGGPNPLWVVMQNVFIKQTLK
jgi:hypothetical protein